MHARVGVVVSGGLGKPAANLFATDQRHGTGFGIHLGHADGQIIAKSAAKVAPCGDGGTSTGGVTKYGVAKQQHLLGLIASFAALDEQHATHLLLNGVAELGIIHAFAIDIWHVDAQLQFSVPLGGGGLGVDAALESAGLH